MRLRMPVLAAGLIAGALALGSSSADATQPAELAGFYANSAQTVVVYAPPAANGKMCFIAQGGQLIGGQTLSAGENLIYVSPNGMGSHLVAGGPEICAAASSTWDDLPNEE